MKTSSIQPDITYMQRCIELAYKGGKATKSNPMVGAVLVFQDEIIGEGYHQKFGGPHAEINAISNVKHTDRHKIKNATLYVSLEPCSHTGKTPPCAHRIVQESIRKVVIGCLDPNQLVAGKGIQYLQDNDIEVVSGILQKEATSLIHKFKANLQLRPYVILKWAQSKDFYISKKDEQTWLTHPTTSVLTHKWRTAVDGILVGKNTAIIDNPALTARAYNGHNPIRIIMDAHLSLPKSLTLYADDEPTWTINTIQSSDNGCKKEIYVEDPFDIAQVLNTLYHQGIYSMIVEGGAAILESFIKADLWDEARMITTPKILQTGISAPNITGRLVSTYQSVDDHISILQNPNR